MPDWTMHDAMLALDPHLDRIDAVCRNGLATYRRYPSEFLLEHSTRASATCTYDHMVAEAERTLSEQRGVVFKEVRGLKLWIIGDVAAVRFKKMDEDGRSRNYPTKQAQDFDKQMPLPGLPFPPLNLVAGYWPDATGTIVQRVQVAKPSGKAISWNVAIVPPAEREAVGARWIEVTRQLVFDGVPVDKFNHHMLTLAREVRGLTQVELADTIHISQGTLSKYEMGVNPAPPEFAEAAGAALGYPAPFFYQAGHPYGFPPFHYRRRKKLSKKALGQIVAEMNIRRMHVQKLAVSYSGKTNRFIPEIDMDEYQGQSRKAPDVEDVTRSLREAWMVPDGPIASMVDLIEENGGIIIPCDFGSDLIDAMSQRIDGMPVLFFVNTGVPSDRLRHTLAHELAHMVLHTVVFKADDEMEREADNFAGAFLMPRDEIRPQLRRFDLRHLANMKGHWKVSMSSIAVRAMNLNLITPYQYKSFFIEMNKLGLRKREPNEPPPETPKMLSRMIEYHKRQLGYTDIDLAGMLCSTLPEFRQMYQPPPEAAKPRLALVK